MTYLFASFIIVVITTIFCLWVSWTTKSHTMNFERMEPVIGGSTMKVNKVTNKARFNGKPTVINAVVVNGVRHEWCNKTQSWSKNIRRIK